MKLLCSISTILLLLSAPITHAGVSQFEPIFPQFSNTIKQRQAMNQIYALGEVSFSNDVRVPFYGVTAPNPVDDGLLKDFKSCTAKSCHFDFKLDANLAKQLKLVLCSSQKTGKISKQMQGQMVQVQHC